MTSSAAPTSSGPVAPGVSAAKVSPASSSTRPQARELTSDEQALLDRARAGRTVKALVLTGARVDVGLWFRHRRVWLAAFDGAIALFAAGPRPYLQTASGEELATTFYSHLSGELVCVPAPELVVRSLAMGPAEGWRMLELILGTAAGGSGASGSSPRTGGVPAPAAQGSA